MVLSDSMSAVLAISKGGSSARALNRVCRQLAAILLATNMFVSLRWLPSELNPADLPSRARDIGQFSLKAATREFLANVVEGGGKASSGWRQSAYSFHKEDPRVRGWTRSWKTPEGSRLGVKQRHSRRRSPWILMRKACRTAERARLHGNYVGVVAMAEKSFLEKQSVGPVRQRSYQVAWEDFKACATERALRVTTLQQLDHAVVNKLNFMFFEGCDVADGMTLLAAVKYFRQDVLRTGALVRAAEAASWVHPGEDSHSHTQCFAALCKCYG